ncbi:MFS transporter [Microvirga sp. HBU67558]|nr:MFS transporter [Microvirga sp. HBU67558]
MSPRAASTDRAADPARHWIVVGMLCLLMLINFADRAVLGLAAVPIMREMGLSHSEFGLIAASFFTFFSLSAAIGGFLVNRVATTWVLAGLALIWSLCQLPMLLPVTVTALVANRVLLGFGEGPAYPVAVHAAYKWFPREHRALPTSLIAVGALAGNGIVAPVIVTVIAAWSWQAAFGLLGLLGIVWCVAWLMVAREGPLVAEGRVTGSVVEPEKQLSYRRLLGCRTVVGVEIVGFSAYWLLTIAIVWLPAFLHQAFGYANPGRLDHDAGFSLPDHSAARRIQPFRRPQAAGRFEPDRGRMGCMRGCPRLRPHGDPDVALHRLGARDRLYGGCVLSLQRDVRARPRPGCRRHAGRAARSRPRHDQRHHDAGGSLCPDGHGSDGRCQCRNSRRNPQRTPAFGTSCRGWGLCRVRPDRPGG